MKRELMIVSSVRLETSGLLVRSLHILAASKTDHSTISGLASNENFSLASMKYDNDIHQHLTNHNSLIADSTEYLPSQKVFLSIRLGILTCPITYNNKRPF